MTTFESVHQDEILGSLTTFDRMIFRGYLTGFFPDGAFQRFLNRRGVLLKDFGRFVEGATAKVKEHVMRLAATAGRPYVYLESTHTAALSLSAEDVLRYLGRKLHGNLRGEVLTDLKKRPEGFRVKHTMKRNSVKMYDKLSVLRIETTINNPHEFKVLRVLETPAGTKRRWLPMGKGVANLWRYAQVVAQANNRYLEALARVQGKSEAIDELDRLCRCRRVNGRRFARFNPVAASDVELFKAVAAGEHLINGFRNRDVTRRLFPQPPASSEEARRRCARISRQIAKLRGHGLVAKVKNSHLYRVTARGYSIIAAVLSFHEVDFPRVYSTASTACG
jgi:hypothetical protein